MFSSKVTFGLMNVTRVHHMKELCSAEAVVCGNAQVSWGTQLAWGWGCTEMALREGGGTIKRRSKKQNKTKTLQNIKDSGMFP